MDQHICDECRVDLSWKVRVTNWTNANGPNGEYCVPCAAKNGLLPVIVRKLFHVQFEGVDGLWHIYLKMPNYCFEFGAMTSFENKTDAEREADKYAADLGKALIS